MKLDKSNLRFLMSSESIDYLPDTAILPVVKLDLLKLNRDASTNFLIYSISKWYKDLNKLLQ